MREFLIFVRQTVRLLYFIRGVVLILVLVLVLCAALVARAEGLPLAEALYFVLITALTIGYGDIAPVTAVGRIASVAIGLIGVISMGILVAVATRALELAAREVHRLGDPGERRER